MNLLDPNGFGIQNVFVSLEQCTQPRFINIRISIPQTEIDPARVVIPIDLTQFIQQKKIDHIQSVIFTALPSNDYPNPQSTPPLQSECVSSYGFIKFDGGDIVSTQLSQDQGYTRPLRAQISCPNPPRFIFIATARGPSAQQALNILPFNGICYDIKLCNYKLNPTNTMELPFISVPLG